ncbi:MAG: hypothetical protein J5697_03975 [Clostridia bacterium]|nr:hypothetical protein [Clostridia bacterium]
MRETENEVQVLALLLPTVIYQNSSATSQLMLGEFKADGGSIVKQADRPLVEGEF